MELRKRLDFRKVALALYIVLFAVYLTIGLRTAEAVNYEVSAELAIPSISLSADVTTLRLENYELKTPDAIVGSFSNAKNKTLLIGHSSTIFQNLNRVKLGDEIIYDEDTYRVESMEVLAKGEISMNGILAGAEQKTLVLMTCAGEDLGGGDATHRLIITALAE